MNGIENMQWKVRVWTEKGEPEGGEKIWRKMFWLRAIRVMMVFQRAQNDESLQFVLKNSLPEPF